MGIEEIRKALVARGWPASAWGTRIMVVLVATNLELKESGNKQLPYLTMLRKYAYSIACEPRVLRAQVDKCVKAGGSGVTAAGLYRELSGGGVDEDGVSSEQGG